MTDSLSRTPLYDWHDSHGARIVDFAGWSMPVQYTSIVEEHTATRQAIGVFDISHMGRFRFDGPGASDFLHRVLTRRCDNLKLGDIRYSLVTNHEGGILDDVLVYHLATANGEPFHMLVVNASNRGKIAAWLAGNGLAESKAGYRDVTTETAMIAVQGPRALQTAQPLVDHDLSALKYYSGVVTEIAGESAIVSRTGYTGEDGCEFIVSAAAAIDVWSRLMELGADQGIRPAGLGARDTLRLEAAMPLYGHELKEQIDPFMAGLGFAVHLKDRDFIGCAALAQLKERSGAPVRIGLQMIGRRVPREHCPILSGTDVVGEVTSGTFSPTLQKPIAMGYVAQEHSGVGTQLSVDIRGKHEPADVVTLPFYTRSKQKD